MLNLSFSIFPEKDVIETITLSDISESPFEFKISILLGLPFISDMMIILLKFS